MGFTVERINNAAYSSDTGIVQLCPEKHTLATYLAKLSGLGLIVEGLDTVLSTSGKTLEQQACGDMNGPEGIGCYCDETSSPGIYHKTASSCSVYFKTQSAPVTAPEAPAQPVVPAQQNSPAQPNGAASSGCVVTFSGQQNAYVEVCRDYEDGPLYVKGVVGANTVSGGQSGQNTGGGETNVAPTQTGSHSILEGCVIGDIVCEIGKGWGTSDTSGAANSVTYPTAVPPVQNTGVTVYNAPEATATPTVISTGGGSSGSSNEDIKSFVTWVSGGVLAFAAVIFAIYDAAKRTKNEMLSRNH